MKLFDIRSEIYSPEACHLFRRRKLKAFRFGLVWFGFFGCLDGFFVWGVLHGQDFVGLASITSAVLLFSLWPAWGRMCDLFIVPPNLHPYFDAKVPGCSLTVGVELLRHSRALDVLAASLGVRRIGEFVSEDDFVDGAGPTWHSSHSGLVTIEALLRHGIHPDVQATRQDLEHIRDRLLQAESQGVRFCFLLRDTHVTNQMEWEQRIGCC